VHRDQASAFSVGERPQNPETRLIIRRLSALSLCRLRSFLAKSGACLFWQLRDRPLPLGNPGRLLNVSPSGCLLFRCRHDRASLQHCGRQDS
jgi:hypothetical protein